MIPTPNKVRHSTTPLPRKWDALPGADKALLIGEVRVHASARICMKLLVFGKPKHLHYFWRRGLGRGNLGGECLGAVSGLGADVFFVPDDGSPMIPCGIEVDPRYFAVMGLTRDNIGTEVITHESGHAAFAYARRVRGKWPNPENEEERFCYPLGRIARGVVTLLTDAGFYD